MNAPCGLRCSWPWSAACQILLLHACSQPLTYRRYLNSIGGMDDALSSKRMPRSPGLRVHLNRGENRPRTLPLLLGLILGLVAPALAAVTPPGPEENTGSNRAEIVLNGIWRFQPASTSATPDPAQWGEFCVPGSWVGDWRIRLPRDPVTRGSNVAWKKLGAATTAGWYERPFAIPSSWGNGAILLRFERLGTDALVWVNGQPAGQVGHLGAEIEIGPWVKPGTEAVLRLFVVASKPDWKDFSFTGAAVPANDGGCAAKGITGDVVLVRRPTGPRIHHVAVLPGIAKPELALRVELAEPAALEGKTLELEVKVFGKADGKQAADFQSRVLVEAGGLVRAAWPWTDAHCWETDDPFLYRLSLRLSGDGFSDGFVVPQFGFREFRVEGRDLFLNGKLIRLRPGEASAASNETMIRADIARRREVGHNILEIWPQDSRERGFTHFWPLYARTASEVGMLLMMPTVRVNDFMPRAEKGLAQWIDLAREDWHKVVNEPSVVVMVPSGNMVWLAADQNPRWLGRSDVPPMHEYQERDWKRMEDVNRRLRAMDPTRPVMHHQGGPRSDIAASNVYLNFAPLQEREEWLSAWADRSIASVQPFSAIEFGTPVDCSVFRNRNGFGNAYSSEALMTEFCAIYLGPAAYAMETDAYRREVLAKDYRGPDPVSGAPRWPMRQNPPALIASPAFQELQRLFQRHTWRSWRTWGLSGGMLPWNEGFTHRRSGYDDLPVPFLPGTRGSYFPRLRKTDGAPTFRDPSYELLPAAEALSAQNQPTLAWLSGPPDHWTGKGHHFREGEAVEKSLVLINDSRRVQSFHAHWKWRTGERVLDSGHHEGQLRVGEILKHPVSLSAPGVNRKTDLVLGAEVNLGGNNHRDEFALRVWPKDRRPNAGDLTLLDPVGRTAAMLGRAADAPDSPRQPLVVIGREALSSGRLGTGVLAELEQQVAEGGTLLVMAQTPEWMTRWWGFRISRHVARRAWPVRHQHPLWEGLDECDLRDWRGAGTLVDPYPEHDPRLPARFLFHWGNQGSVSCAPVEKPHLSGWTPLLQCEFDLQYSPLMELRRGKGRAILCLLDLEDQAPVDPAAESVLARLLDYARQPVPPHAPTEGVAANDLPPRIASEPTLAAPLAGAQACLSDPAAGSFRKALEALQPLHTLAEAKPWLRFPRWRLTRVEHQLRANAGEEFPADSRFFHPRCDSLSLGGLWQLRPITRPNAETGKPLPDPGINDHQRSLCQPDFDLRLFLDEWMPEAMLDDVDGDAVLRRRIDLPAHWQSKTLYLELGKLQCTAMVFFNGEPVSGTTPIPEGTPIVCEIPAACVAAGPATIALRLWDASGPGGFMMPAATQLRLSLPDAPAADPLYHPDYRNDFKDGDEPYRYFRW